MQCSVHGCKSTEKMKRGGKKRERERDRNVVIAHFLSVCFTGSCCS